jgi:NADPH2:quinone reductase
MRAVRVLRHGNPADVVEVQDDVPVPDIPPGHVRIAVSAASLNYGDIARCRGGVASVTGQPPFTLGMDACGVVESAGQGAEKWLGRRVVAMCAQSFGGIAELAVAPVNGVFDAPAELDDVESAAFLLPFHTTYLAVHERAELHAGEYMLVVGGASALGTAAIQLGVAADAHVLAVAGGPQKGDLCRSLGADVSIDHTSDDLFEVVMASTNEHGVDVACDLVGGSNTETVWTTMAYRGRYVPIGFNDDPDSGLTGRPLRKIATGNFSVHGVLLSYNDAPVALRRFGVQPNPPAFGPKVHAALCALVSSGTIRPVIGRRITMGEVAATLEDHAARRTMGRSVVDLTLG